MEGIVAKGRDGDIDDLLLLSHSQGMKSRHCSCDVGSPKFGYCTRMYVAVAA